MEGGDVGTSWFEAENGSKVLSRFRFFERRGLAIPDWKGCSLKMQGGQHPLANF